MIFESFIMIGKYLERKSKKIYILINEKVKKYYNLARLSH